MNYDSPLIRKPGAMPGFSYFNHIVNANKKVYTYPIFYNIGYYCRI